MNAKYNGRAIGEDNGHWAILLQYRRKKVKRIKLVEDSHEYELNWQKEKKRSREGVKG